MSAFVVTTKHIDYLVAAALAYKITLLPSADVIGSTLLEENYRSVNHRYHDADAAPAYRYTDPKLPIIHIQVIKAAQCLRYQSCEHDGWERSNARHILEGLITEAISRLPGYNDAAWAID